MHEKYAPEIKNFLNSVILTTNELQSLTASKEALDDHSSGVPSSSFKKKTLSFGELSQKSDSESQLAGGEDTGDVIGAIALTMSKGVGSGSESDNEDAECGMAIDSDAEQEPVKEYIPSVTVTKIPESKSSSEISVGKKRSNEHLDEAEDGSRKSSKGGDKSLAIDPNTLFSEPVASTKPVPVIASVGVVADKTNFKKKKTLKALQRKADRMNREQKKDKDDIDDIFGGFG